MIIVRPRIEGDRSGTARVFVCASLFVYPEAPSFRATHLQDARRTPRISFIPYPFSLISVAVDTWGYLDIPDASKLVKYLLHHFRFLC